MEQVTMAQNLPDPSPYAGGEPTESTSQGGKEQVGAPNTKRATKGEVIPTSGGGRDASDQGKPYANTTGTCATRQAEKGLAL